MPFFNCEDPWVILHVLAATSIFFCKLSIHTFSFSPPPLIFLWVIRLFLMDLQELIT